MSSRDSETTSRVNLSGNSVSRVWRDRDLIYKRQPKFLTDNEIWCLQKLYPSGYVPRAWQVDVDVIGMQYIQPRPVEWPGQFMTHYERIIEALEEAGIRHGDLSIYSVIPCGTKPYLIDFAESRLHCDPRIDKRPEGDKYLLYTTMEQYANGLQIPHT